MSTLILTNFPSGILAPGAPSVDSTDGSMCLGMVTRAIVPDVKIVALRYFATVEIHVTPYIWSATGAVLAMGTTQLCEPGWNTFPLAVAFEAEVGVDIIVGFYEFSGQYYSFAPNAYPLVGTHMSASGGRFALNTVPLLSLSWGISLGWLGIDVMTTTQDIDVSGPVVLPPAASPVGTGIYAEAARQLTAAVLIDSLQILNVGNPVTVGFEVTRQLTEVGTPIRGLVQTTTLANAVESRVDSTYSVKVPQGTEISAGQAVRVVDCIMEPDLVGKVLLLDKVSKNGMAMIRKAVASDFEVVNQEGKEGL